MIKERLEQKRKELKVKNVKEIDKVTEEGEKLKIEYKDRIDSLLNKGKEYGLDNKYFYTNYFHEAYINAEKNIWLASLLTNGGKGLSEEHRFSFLTILFDIALKKAEKEVEELTTKGKSKLQILRKP